MKPLAIKIGGSTLGSGDTTVEDLVTLQKRGVPLVVIHGGGREVTGWLGRLNTPTTFVRGLRVTDLETLRVVTAVLAGLVNKELVASICRLGGKAAGISGVDGGLIQAKNRTPELGYTGEELKIDTSLLEVLLKEGYIPVIAPVSLSSMEKTGLGTALLNVNGDTAASEIAVALGVEKLIFLTDVPGLQDGSRRLIEKISPEEARGLVASGVASGGMTAKLEACILASRGVRVTRIVDGRTPHALLNEIEGRGNGTTIAG